MPNAKLKKRTSETCGNRETPKTGAKALTIKNETADDEIVARRETKPRNVLSLSDTTSLLSRFGGIEVVYLDRVYLRPRSIWTESFTRENVYNLS